MLGSAAALASMAASMSKPGSDTSIPATPGPDKIDNAMCECKVKLKKKY